MSTAETPRVLSARQRQLTPAEVVEKYPVLSERLLTQWRYERKSPPYLKLGKFVLYPEDDLTEWMQARVHSGGESDA